MIAIIIGATSGIGRGMAARLAASGWTVGATGRRMERLQELKDKCGDNVHIAQMDVRSDDAAAVLDALLEKTGAPDLFMYVSGIGFQNPDLDEKMELDMVRTNCEGMVRLVDHFVNYVRASHDVYGPEKKARVAVVSSVAGTAGIGVAPAYSATKKMQSTYISALCQLSRMEKIPVEFTDIKPGFVATEILNPEKKYPMIIPCSKAVDYILKGLKRGKRIIIFDWKFKLLVAFWRLIPRFIWERLTIVKN